jgi:hypothetical protein
MKPSDTLLLPLLVVCAAGMLVTGCPHPPKHKPVAADASAKDAFRPRIPACPLDIVILPEDVCDGIFTADGHACAVCKGVSRCIDAVDQVYCAIGGCLRDPACKVITGSFPPTGGAVRAPERLTAKPQIFVCAQ